MRAGIDVSDNNHPGGRSIDWHTVRASGIEWAAVKITEGAHFRSRHAESDLHAAAATGMEVVGYHFARPSLNTAPVEADNFRGAWQNIGGHGRLALDVEDGRQLGWERLGAWVKDFMRLSGVTLVYWNRDYNAHLGGRVMVGHQQRWIAAPGVRRGEVDCGVHQYGQGSVHGIVGPVDLNDVYYPAPLRPGSPQTPSHRPAAPAVHVRSTLRRGATGDAVRALQHGLIHHGSAITADGVFGPVTEAAVKLFQLHHKLAADGIVGPATWKAIG